jgi:uncharacterized phage protein gp47/JayE
MAFGLTAAGFSRKRLEDIRDELRAEIAGVFGSKLNTAADSAIAQLIDVFAGQLAVTWEGLEGVYQAFDPASAEGVALENLAALFKLTRTPATSSVGTIRVTGTAGTVIPEGYEVRSPSTDVNVVTTDVAVIPVLGFVDVPARTVDTGPVIVEAGDVTTAVDFVSGVDSVTNLTDFIPGAVVESDQELALRRDGSLQVGGAAVDRAIRGQLLALPFVTQALVISNRSGTTDANGFPPHSVNAIVWPTTADTDEQQAIIDVLVRNAPGGIRANGAVQFTVTDDYGYTDPEPYGFSFATELDVYVDVIVTTDANYPGNGDDQITAAIVAAGNSLSVGADVRVLTLLCEVADIPGVLTAEVRVKVGSAPGPSDTANIVVAVDEVARFATARTQVNP